MTKQEFAIKLLFWLMPWPLSKAFPGLLITILAGPAALTPDQWAQAVYDTLSKYLTQARAYAQSLFTILLDVPPIDQLILAADALNSAIQNAISALAAFKAILDHLADYTLDQIWQAFLDTLAAMADLTSAINTLLNAMQQIPGLEIPDVPPPEYIPPEEIPPLPPDEIPPVPPAELIPPEEIPPLPPDEVEPVPPPPPAPYIWPFPPIFSFHPGLGLPAPTYVTQKPRPQGRWVAHSDDNNWESDDTYPTETLWNDPGQFWYPDDTMSQMLAIGTWPTNYRPTKMRLQFTAPEATCYVRLWNISGDFIIGTNSTYTSGDEIILDFSEALDLGMLKLTNITAFGNIEFFEV